MLLENTSNFIARKIVDGAKSNFKTQEVSRKDSVSPLGGKNVAAMKGNVSGDFSHKQSKELHAVDSDMQKA